jgi:hypothetical protein
MKAIFVRLFVPVYFVLSILVTVIWGVKALDDIVFGFFNNFLMLLILASLGKRQLPFSIAPSVRGQAGSFLRGLLTFLLIGVLGFIHYLLARKPLLLAFGIPFQVIIIYLLMRVYRQATWKSISV